MKQLSAHLQARFIGRRLIDRKAKGVIFLDEADHTASIRKPIEVGHGEHRRATIHGEHSREPRLFGGGDEQHMRKRCSCRNS